MRVTRPHLFRAVLDEQRRGHVERRQRRPQVLRAGRVGLMMG